jgi:hypothetical protein
MLNFICKSIKRYETVARIERVALKEDTELLSKYNLNFAELLGLLWSFTCKWPACHIQLCENLAEVMKYDHKLKRNAMRVQNYTEIYATMHQMCGK